MERDAKIIRGSKPYEIGTTDLPSTALIWTVLLEAEARDGRTAARRAPVLAAPHGSPAGLKPDVAVLVVAQLEERLGHVDRPLHERLRGQHLRVVAQGLKVEHLLGGSGRMAEGRSEARGQGRGVGF